MSADIIINVVDASHLERDLFLTQQLLDMDKKMIVALNMMDEVEKNNISIDIDALEAERSNTLLIKLEKEIVFLIMVRLKIMLRPLKISKKNLES
jgi:Fe2+ transport system protein B